MRGTEVGKDTENLKDSDILRWLKPESCDREEVHFRKGNYRKEVGRKDPGFESFEVKRN